MDQNFKFIPFLSTSLKQSFSVLIHADAQNQPVLLALCGNKELAPCSMYWFTGF